MANFFRNFQLANQQGPAAPAPPVTGAGLPVGSQFAGMDQQLPFRMPPQALGAFFQAQQGREMARNQSVADRRAQDIQFQMAQQQQITQRRQQAIEAAQRAQQMQAEKMLQDRLFQERAEERSLAEAHKQWLREQGEREFGATEEERKAARQERMTEAGARRQQELTVAREAQQFQGTESAKLYGHQSGMQKDEFKHLKWSQRKKHNAAKLLQDTMLKHAAGESSKKIMADFMLQGAELGYKREELKHMWKVHERNSEDKRYVTDAERALGEMDIESRERVGTLGIESTERMAERGYQVAEKEIESGERIAERGFQVTERGQDIDRELGLEDIGVRRFGAETQRMGVEGELGIGRQQAATERFAAETQRQLGVAAGSRDKFRADTERILAETEKMASEGTLTIENLTANRNYLLQKKQQQIDAILNNKKLAQADKEILINARAQEADRALTAMISMGEQRLQEKEIDAVIQQEQMMRQEAKEQVNTEEQRAVLGQLEAQMGELGPIRTIQDMVAAEEAAEALEQQFPQHAEAIRQRMLQIRTMVPDDLGRGVGGNLFRLWQAQSPLGGGVPGAVLGMRSETEYLKRRRAGQ